MRFFQMSDRTTEQNSAGGTASQPYGPRSGGHDSDCWAMTPSGMRGVLNDAVAIYFADATLASAFVARLEWRVQGRDGWRHVPGAQ
jgi:hypothetical protein